MKHPFRIAWIVSSPTPYKAPLFAKMHARPEFDIRFYFLAGSDPQRPWQFELSGFDYRVLPGFGIRTSLTRRSYKRFNPSVLRELRREKYDAVVICGYDHPTTILTLMYCVLTRTPFFMWGESHILKPRSALKQWLKRYILFPMLRKCRGALVTGTMARKYWESVGVPCDRITVVANTPDIPFFIAESDRVRSGRQRVRADLNLDSRAVGIFIGRFVNAKAVDVLLHAMERLPSHRRPQLLLVGDGPLLRDLKEIADRRQLPVTFLGFQQPGDLPGLYTAADFFVLPSRHEPWGVVVNEAMACALPVVLSDQVGAGFDLLRHKENGYRVTTNDSADLADALDRITALDSADRRRMGEISRNIVSEWTHDRSVRNFITALEWLPEYRRQNRTGSSGVVFPV